MLNIALAHQIFDLLRDVDVIPALRGVEAELFAQVSHAADLAAIVEAPQPAGRARIFSHSHRLF